MILFTLLCLSLGYTFALPAPPNTPTDTHFSFFTRDADRFDDRSTLGVLWSCLSTIFLCTWVAIHPNIPGPKDSQLVVLRRRMALMGYAILTPEIMIFWALRQRQAANYLAERHKKHGWTMAHAFFLIMGGFALHDKQKTALRILEYNELETLSEAGKIAWPSITEEEIQDRSKGDFLSKGIVFLQMGWFITQFIARCGYKLWITELEAVTLGFTTLTIITYSLWWHKPLDVRCSVPIYLLENANPVSEGIHSGSPAATPLSDHPLSDLAHPDTSCEPDEGLESTPTQERDPSPQGRNPSNTMEPPSHNNSTATFNADDVFEVQRSRSVASIQKKHGILRFPVVALFTGSIDAVSSDTLDHNVPLCVPTFYSPKVDDKQSFVSLMSAMFALYASGVIISLAWLSLNVPSESNPNPERSPEQLAGDASLVAINLCITSLVLLHGFPALFSRLFVKLKILRRRRTFWGSEGLGLATHALIAIYLISRITFLILSCIELRALPPTKLVGIKWLSFFPHIG